jgi:low affinity Fe/Cu permease
MTSGEATPTEEVERPATHDAFRRLASRTAHLAGRPIAFGLAVATIVTWGLTGPVFGFSDTWQLVVNTGTTILTFLMVFLIQNTQNRDAAAIHLKLDELIRATSRARNDLIAAETLGDDELLVLQAEFVTFLATARRRPHARERHPIAEPFEADEPEPGSDRSPRT